MTSCNALVYEAIQRVYRNAVVDLIRSSMQAAYPDDYEKRVMSAIPTWDDIVSAAARSAATGVVAHPHQDVFDYLDVSHFPVLLNNYFRVLAPVEGLPPEQVSQLEKQVVSYAREIKTIRDPLSHPGTSDIRAFDAFRAVDNASRALSVLGLPEAAEKIEPLLREVATKASAPGVASMAPGRVSKPVRLLPRPGILAGRDDLLTGLHVRLSSGVGLEPRMVALCGLGGAGKTSLAVEYAHEHLDEVGLAWQFAAENPDVLAAEFSELAGQLRVQDAAGTLDPVAAVHNVLATFSAAWLLVLDNAPDLASVERFGPENPGTLAVRANLAGITRAARDAAGARDQFAALLPVFERVLGPDHLDTLAVREGLAWSTGEAGDKSGARDQFAALVPVAERLLGPEHPRTLNDRAGLARWTGGMKDTAGARDPFAALLPIFERVLGPEHPDTLYIRHSLARWTGQAGDPASARDQFTVLLPMRERVLGPDHPDTRIAHDHLAFWTGEAGDAAAARDQYAALLVVSEQLRGPEHRRTLGVRGHLARWTGEAEDPVAARDQYAALLSVLERVLGPDHPDTLTTRRNLADWTAKSDDGVGSKVN